jgi:hypothetical protein
VIPAVWFVVFNVVTDGAVTTNPVPTDPNVTASVLEPVNGVTGLTITFAAVPGPVAVLQVRETVAGVAVRRSAAVAGMVDPTSARTSHKADRLAWSDDIFISKSCSRTIYCEGFFAYFALRPGSSDV